MNDQDFKHLVELAEKWGMYIVTDYDSNEEKQIFVITGVVAAKHTVQECIEWFMEEFEEK